MIIMNKKSILWYRIWQLTAFAFIFINVFLFENDCKSVDIALWSNPWFGLYFLISTLVLIMILCRYYYLLGVEREREQIKHAVTCHTQHVKG